MGGKIPKRKTDKELYDLILRSIENVNYIIRQHAQDWLKERCINDLEVLNILAGKKGRKRRRNENKEKYEACYDDWNYCIEGVDVDGVNIRIIISFEGMKIMKMIIITVMRIVWWKRK